MDMNELPNLQANDIIAMALPLIILFIILGVLMLVGFAMYAIRSWMVQKAILQTQKDIADIKNHLINSQAITSTEPSREASVPTPTDMPQ